MNFRKVLASIMLAFLMSASSTAVGSNRDGSATYVYALSDSQYAEMVRRGDLAGAPDGTKNIGNSVAYAEKHNTDNEVLKNNPIDEGSFNEGSCLNGGNCDNGYFCDTACGRMCDDPRWTVSADYIVLGRVGAPNQTLIESWIIDEGSSETELLNSSDLNQGFHGGPRLGLVRHGKGCFDLELLYFQIDGWSSTQSHITNNVWPLTSIEHLVFRAPVSILITTPTLPNEPMQFTYASKIYNSELNLRWDISNHLSMLAGFRWLELRENLYGGVFGGESPASWNTITQNDLYGFQLGWDAILFRRNRFSIDGIVKAGIYGNYAKQTTALDRYFDETLGDSTTHAAFLGEVGLQCKFQLNDKLVLRAGYEALWLQGMALAPGQIHETNFQTNQVGMDTSGSVLYHGATAGLEYSF
jgi:hypothetical protein